MRSILVAGLDVGSTSTRAVIGECAREFQRPALRVLGVGRTPTAGVRKDVVTDLERPPTASGLRSRRPS